MYGRRMRFFGFMPFAGLALLGFLAFGGYALYSAGYGSGYRTALLAGESAALLAPAPGGGLLFGLCFAGLAFFGLLFAFGGLMRFLVGGKMKRGWHGPGGVRQPLAAGVARRTGRGGVRGAGPRRAREDERDVGVVAVRGRPRGAAARRRPPARPAAGAGGAPSGRDAGDRRRVERVGAPCGRGAAAGGADRGPLGCRGGGRVTGRRTATTAARVCRERFSRFRYVFNYK